MIRILCTSLNLSLGTNLHRVGGGGTMFSSNLYLCQTYSRSRMAFSASF
jgi:hypothetical protein